MGSCEHDEVEMHEVDMSDGGGTPRDRSRATSRITVGIIEQQAETRRQVLILAAERPRPRARAGQVLTVFSPKGGVGTSTLVVNLACALRTRGHHVAIVDSNVSFGNVNIFLNLPPRTSMLQLVGDPNGIQEASVEK